MGRKKTTEEVIREIHDKFGNQFDTSKVEYKGNSIPIELKCNICGETIFPTRGNLMDGHGCPGCKGNKKRNTQWFINKMESLYPNMFSYEKTNYQGRDKKVIVTCIKHGDFERTPADLYRGRLCKECSYEPKRKVLEDFIQEANEIHNGRYDYSKFVYKNNHTKGIIICPKHGEFEMTPKNHIVGKQNCPYCRYEGIQILKPKDPELFKQQVIEMYGDLYGLDKCEYIDSKHTVKIKCPKHGYFDANPVSLLQRKGCPKCRTSHLEGEIMTILDKEGITYIYQKKFKWLGVQSLDFYLPEYNIAIECQGGQHFFPVDYFGGETYLQHTQKLDENKRIRCNENDIKILYYTNVNLAQYPYEVIKDKYALLEEIKKSKI